METEDETEDERGKVNEGSGWSQRWHGADANTVLNGSRARVQEV